MRATRERIPYVHNGIPILSAQRGHNDVAFAGVAAIYIRPDDLVLDATWGMGRWWKLANVAPRVVRMDNRPVGDIRADYRRMPFKPGIFDVVALDPPYQFGTRAPVKEELDGYYNNERPERGARQVIGMYGKAMGESWRLLKIGGFLVMKGMDQIESGKRWTFLHYPHLLPGAAVQTFSTVDALDPTVTVGVPIEGASWHLEDTFTVIQKRQPNMRHPHQFHARKNESLFVVLRKVVSRAAVRLNRFPEEEGDECVEV